MSMAMDLFDLRGKVALVTGTSRGLGAGMARALASAGADVAVHDRERPCATEEHLRGMGVRTACLDGDLMDRAATDRLVAETLERMGRLVPLERRWGSAQNIADAVAFLASDKAGYITGQVVRVDGGMIV